MDACSTAELVALDWGTSSCRAYLMRRDGRLLQQRANSSGIMHVTETARREGRSRAEAFDQALRQLCSEWFTRATHPLPIIAGGMIGSDQGWESTPYVDLPIDPLRIPLPLHPVPSSLGTVHIVPGLAVGGPLPGVMRGEETQITGALLAEQDDNHPAQERVMVLPGTHSKWVYIREGVITDFSTHMSGEFFALAMQESILARLHQPSREIDWDSYHRGVEIAMGESGRLGLLGILFSARSLALTGELERTGIGDYVSGLVIGSEVNQMVEHWLPRGVHHVDLLGDSSLCSRYTQALNRLDIAVAVADPHVTPRALAYLADRAELFTAPTPSQEPC